MINEIHASPNRFVLAVAGGGASAITDLLAVPGASATVIEASVPYHPNALSDYLGRTPESAASARTARELAMASWLRGRALVGDHDDLFGLGATCALTTTRQRRGTNRCHIALQSATETLEISLLLTNPDRGRADQERLVADTILHYIAQCCGVTDKIVGLQPDEVPVERRHRASSMWTDLLLGSIASTHVTPQPMVLFPGAFNPIHDGHQEMLRHAEQILASKVHLEISIHNVDKPPIDFLEMSDRQQQLTAYPLIYSSAATFIEKSRIFPGSTFVVGTDTLARIADKRYYDGNATTLAVAIDEMQALAVSFLVFGRIFGDQFHTLEDLDLPAALRDLCRGVDQGTFRSDTSSTVLRRD